MRGTDGLKLDLDLANIGHRRIGPVEWSVGEGRSLERGAFLSCPIVSLIDPDHRGCR
jgi:hypothetical protein